MNTIKISRTFLKTINVFVILMTIISQLGWGASKALADSKNPPVISEGDSVSVMMSENGATTKTLTVSALAFTDLDINADTVSGIADAGASVDVWACDSSNCYNRHATANTDGKWLANWHVMGTQDDEQNTFDLVRGTWVGSQQWDDDGDRTMFGQNIPNPYIEASLNGRWIQAREWALGTVLTLTIDDPSNGAGVYYTGTATVEHNPDNPGDPNDIRARFDWPAIGLQPGFVVTVTGNGTSKTLIIPALTVTAVDQVLDTVSGVATLGAQLHVCASIPGYCVTRWVTADPSTGAWTAYYGVVGVPPDDTATVDLLPGSNGWVYEVDTDGDLTFVDWRVPNPSFSAQFPENEIHGYEWPLGALVTLTIDDPSNDPIVDFTDTQTVVITDWDPNQTFVRFTLGDFNLEPGFLATMTYGTTMKTLVVASLSVTAVDPNADTVSGTAAFWDQVQVCASIPGRCINRYVTPDVYGNWIANYSVAGVSLDDPDIVDLQPGSNGWAAIFDDDGDHTIYDWRVLAPYIEASLNGRWIQARDWPLGKVLTLTIDDPSNGAGVYYTGTATVEHNPDNPGDPNDIRARFDWPAIGLQPGFVVTVTGNGTSKTLIIPALTVTAVDQVLDTISGVATLGAQLHVCASIPGYCVTRWVTADPSTGAWTAYYGVVGVPPDDTATVDLLPGSNGWVYEVDTDGDLTFVDWRVLNPYMTVIVDDNWVEGVNWPLGASVTMTIIDDGDDGYSDTQIVTDAPWGNGETQVKFEFAGVFDVQPGHIVTLSAGVTTRTHTVLDVNVTEIDPQTDKVYGTTIPNAVIHASIFHVCCYDFMVKADEYGNWGADFSGVYDIVGGTQGGAERQGPDGNFSRIDWIVPNPIFDVRANTDQIETWEWPLGNTLTVKIYSTGNEADPVTYTTSEKVTDPAPWGDPRTFVSFNLYGTFDIQPGYLVTISDGTTIKKHIVTSLAFDVMDKDADTVSGFAEAGSRVDVWACDNTNCYNRHVTAGTDGITEGKWIANWHEVGDQPDEQNTFDLVGGTWVDSSQGDNDGDSTMYGQNMPNPYVEAAPYSDWIHARGWPDGTPVTLTIDDPSNGVGGNYTEHGTMGPNPWNPGDPNDIVADFRWPDQFAPGPGYVITMTGDIAGSPVTKTLTVADLRVLSANPVTNLVSGVATPGAPSLEVCLNRPGTCFSRYPTVDGTGQWSAYYTDEDLQPGDNGWAAEYDTDNDRTWYDWRVLNPYFVVKPNNEQVNAYEWPVGDVLTMEIYAPGAPDNPVSITTSTVVGNTPWNSGQTYAFFDLAGVFDIQPEYTVSISNGTTTKTLTVSGLTFTHIDIENDLVEGVGNPNYRVNVWACDWSGCFNRHVIADGDGNWSVDFAHVGTEGNEQAIFNIVNGTWIDSEQMDDDGDCTGFGMNVSLPYIEVSPGSHWVHARGNWPDGTITMSIDDPNENGPVNYTASATFGQNPNNPGDPNDRLADFNLNGFDLEAGFTITMTGGGISKTYTIQSLELTAYDLVADTLSGTANAGHQLQVCVNMPGYCVSRHITVDGGENWLADYHNPGARSDEQETVNLQGGSNGWVADYEDDGDQTWLDWNLPGLASATIGADGGTLTLTTGNGDVSLYIPPRAGREDTPFSITDQGGGYELAIYDTTMSIVSSYTINPPGTTFNPPATVTFQWPDEGNDGIVDGTTLQESHLLLIKDGLIYTPACAVNPDCDMDTNTLTVQVSSLSLFELADPKDSDGDGLDDDPDACPNENPNGYDADHNGCTDTAVGLRQYLANLPVNVVPSNIKTSLLAKVDSVIASLNRGKEQAAIGQLRAFINEVQAQRGKKITAATADLLIAYARNVMAKMP